MAIKQSEFSLTEEEFENLNQWLIPVADRMWAADDFLMPVSVIFTFSCTGTVITAQEGYVEITKPLARAKGLIVYLDLFAD
jgi:hypothetical protein